MKYVITGSTGHISKPVTEALVKAGHDVTVITSKGDKKAEIESLGAQAAIGSVEDRAFLTKAFAGADAVYLMIPPTFAATDWLAYQRAIADNYIAALKTTGVKHVLLLSSVGADLRRGVGPVDGTGYLEEQSKQLTNATVKILRPSYFYYNLLSQISMIKHLGFMGSAQPADFKMVIVHPRDIAAVAAASLLSLSFRNGEIEYIASDDSHTWTDIARVIGTAIGQPDLKYVEFTDEQNKEGMLKAGLLPDVAEQYVAMGRALRTGAMLGDYYKHQPAKLGATKLEDFAKEFAAAYQAA